MNFFDKLEERPRLIWSITVSYMILIFILSSISHLPQPSREPYLPVIEHIMEYAILSVLLFSALLSTRKYDMKEILILAVIVTVLYGLSDEIHQLYVPGRVSSLDDFIADTLGALVGSFMQVFRLNSD